MNPIQYEKYPSIQRFGLYTAILLILAVLMPVLVPTPNGTELIFANFWVFDFPMLPTSAKLYVMFPLLGGILCLVAYFLKNHIGRAILYLVVGFTPYFLALVLTNELWGMLEGLAGRGGAGMEMPSLSFQLSYLMPISLMALIVAAFVGSTDRENKIAPMLALGGGILLLLMMIIPVEMGPEGAIALISTPFKAFEDDFTAGAILLLFFVLLIAACILGIAWGARHRQGVNHSLRIKYLLRIAFLELVVLGVLTMMVKMDQGDILKVLVMVLLMLLKGVGMFVAPFYAKCLGFIEILSYLGRQMPAPQMTADMGPFAPVTLPETEKELPFGPDSAATVEKSPE